MARILQNGWIPLSIRITMVLHGAGLRERFRIDHEQLGHIFYKLSQRHPDLFPGVSFTSQNGFPYSEEIESAWSHCAIAGRLIWTYQFDKRGYICEYSFLNTEPLVDQMLRESPVEAQQLLDLGPACAELYMKEMAQRDREFAETIRL